jgi:hypothetical protein
MTCALVIPAQAGIEGQVPSRSRLPEGQPAFAPAPVTDVRVQSCLSRVTGARWAGCTLASPTETPTDASPQYELSCTACTARPEGSTMFFRLASHSSAAAVEQATEGPPGTHSAAQACG